MGNREWVSSAVAVTALHMHAQSHFQGQLAEEAESGADPESKGGEKSNVNIKESREREREIRPPCERTTSATVALNREGAGTAIKVIRLSTRENGRAGCWPKGPHVILLNQ